ncbi:MAG: DUF4062 domain-containing protein [Pirellula sp.]
MEKINPKGRGIMNKRYQVFLSSTFADLAEERKEVMAALQKAGYFVAGMELFPSDDDESWEVIKRVIDQSDYYVLVVGGRYGSIGKDGKSFTEMEYDYAKENKLPVLAFLHNDPTNLPSKHVEQSHADKLDRFKNKIEKLHNRRSWSTKHDLATEVLASISQTVNLRPRIGWVRGDVADLNEVLTRKLEDLRVENQKIREERDSLSIRLADLDTDARKQIIAWGDDEVELAIEVKEKGSEGEMDEVSFTTHWSRIFDLVAPTLIGWCETYKATKGIVAMLAEELSRQATEARELETYGLSAGSLTTIRNQLLALELIHVETERRQTSLGRSLSFIYVERWRLSERGLREHSHKHAIKHSV